MLAVSVSILLLGSSQLPPQRNLSNAISRSRSAAGERRAHVQRQSEQGAAPMQSAGGFVGDRGAPAN